ncbi:MAG: hypothetical protein A2Y02_03345 [Omnitrophica bacterium GWA2_52_12]|nr:MAG: hypothetical protein A2Y02_03345 [Omnitrophica bacterium GWA2_52_12]
MNKFKKLRKKSMQAVRKSIKSCLACCLLATFSIQTAFAAAPVQGNADLAQEPARAALQSFFETLQIPSDAGQIEHVAIPRGLKNHSNPILFIQDAHANPEAQKNIAAILSALAESNQLAGVAVEGAFGPVDARLLDIFDDAKTNREFSERLVSQGQLTGAEIFSRTAASDQVPVQGVDDSSLYLQSFQAYRQVKQDTASESVLEEYRKARVRMETTSLNSDLAAFLRERRHWHEKSNEAADYVRLTDRLAQSALQLDLANPENQFQWPALMRLVRSIQLEDKMNAERIKADMARLKKEWAGKENAFLFEEAGEALEAAIRDRGFGAWLEQQSTFTVKTVRRFFEELMAASAEDGVSLLNYPDLLNFAAILILHEEIDAQKLLEELAPLEARIEAKLIRNPEESEIVKFSKDLELTEKLFHLRLTREDHKLLLERAPEFTAAVFHERLLKVLALSGAKPVETGLLTQSTLDLALEFYHLSAARDAALVKKTAGFAGQSAKKNQNQRNKITALIAGGFHQEGILRELNARGIAHAVITPKIKSMPAESLYEKIMSGHGSMLAAAFSAAPATLMAELLGQRGYLVEAAAPGRREDEILEALFDLRVKDLMGRGLTPEGIHEVLSNDLQRAGANGLIGRATLMLKDAVHPGSLPELSLVLPDHGMVLHYEITPEGARQTRVERLPPAKPIHAPTATSRFAERALLGFLVSPLNTLPAALTEEKTVPATAGKPARAEMRVAAQEDMSLDSDAYQWLKSLPRNQAYTRTLALMQALEEKKKAQTPPLTATYAQSLHNMGPARNIPVIEAVVDEMAQKFNLKTLPIAYRAAVVLQAFDAERFPEVHKHLLDMLRSVNISNVEDRLSASDYQKLMTIGESEHLTGIDQYILLHTALNRYLIDLPRKEIRALEKEALVLELMKELDEPGTGDLPQMVFLTDLHGGTKTGDLIGYSLGLKNYRRIRSVHDLTQRLQAEGIEIEKKNIIFVGGSDYVDRGPNPYRAFQFVRWLRDKGKLKFINGNHDLWKDWNLLGVHQRVHDALRTIANSGKLSEEAIRQYAGRLEPKDEHMQRRDGTFASFVTTIGKTPEQIAQLQEGLYALVGRFLSAVHERGPADDIIDAFANEVIDFGANDNHSLEWWSRDWYEHAGWAETFLDEMNEILINRVTNQANGLVADSAGRLAAQLTEVLNVDPAALPEILREDRDVLLANLAQGRLFNSIEAAVFSAHEDVKTRKAEIEELKAKNTAIRKSNESLAAQGRFSEQVPQFRVPTTFPLTAGYARQYLDKIKAQITALSELISGSLAPVLDVELVTPENYRSNSMVVETALWNLQHLRLVHLDAYGNAYLHGIIPIEEDSLDFNVKYKGLPGLAAIERMQYDIRRFFEKFTAIPNTTEFRAEMEREVGEAFRILNNWYSDKTAYLKPAAFQKFVDKGGPAAYSYAAASPFHARDYDPRNGLMHVGHIDLTKMRDAKAPYWIFGFVGGIINGDHDLSEGYNGLGGVITHFMRDAEGRLTGLRRFGYKETLASLSKDLKDAEKDKKKLEKKLNDLGEITSANEEAASRLQQEIGDLAGEITDLKQRRDLKRPQVDEAGGETIEDITLHELPEKEQSNAKPFLEGGDYAYYYAQRFLEELIRDYRELQRKARERGLKERVVYYRTRLADIRQQLKFLREKHGADHPLHPARGVAASEMRAPKTLDDLNGEIEVVVSAVINQVDRWGGDVIDTQTQGTLRDRLQRIAAILTEDEPGVLEAGLIQLISGLRGLSNASGDAAADDLEKTLELARQWESTLKRRSEMRFTESELGLDQYLANQGRNAEFVFSTGFFAASRTVERALSERFPDQVRERFFGQSDAAPEETQPVVPRAETKQKMAALVTSQETVERPKTVVLVSVDGKVPQIDPALMDLLPGSRVVVLDSLEREETVGRNHFAKLRLPPGVSPEYATFHGALPTLNELKSIFKSAASLRQAAQAEPGQAALPLLVLPYVDEGVLNRYAALQADDGLVVRTPKVRGVKLRESFSRFLGLRAAPSQLRDVLPDVFKVQVRERGFSSAFIPLGAEGRFASLVNAMLHARTVESAA